MHKLKTLRKLDLSYNELHDLPSEPAFFGQMKALEFLALDGNAVQAPHAITGLRHAKQLKYLSLQDNPIQMTLQQTYRFEIASLLPNLFGLDENVVTFDEFTYRMVNRSIRFCSMNTFSRLPDNMTTVFVSNISAEQHIDLLNNQLQLISKKRIKNDPLVYIRKNLKEAGLAKVAFQMRAKCISAIVVIQRFARGFITRLRMKKEMLIYFDSIGEIELTLSVEEERHHRALKTLNLYLPVLTSRYRKWKVFTRAQAFISKFIRGWRVRSQLDWAMDGPIKLRENRYFIFLKEQKYLLKHILREKQKLIPPFFANQIINLISDYPDYYLAKHVDLDLFDIPRPAVLQIGVPASRILAAQQKPRPQALREGRSLFELCISRIGNEKEQQQQLKDLQKLRPTFSKLSRYELQVGRQQIIPQDQKRNLIRMHHQNSNKQKKEGQTDSLLISPVSSVSMKGRKELSTHQACSSDNLADGQDTKLFKKILRRQGQDFIRLDLHKSESVDINSGKMMERLLRVLVQWNKNNDANQIHFYVGELFKRQVAIVRIQSWTRQVMRTLRFRRELVSRANLVNKDRIDVVLKPCQLTILRCLQLQRAAKIIQNYFSMYRLRKRIKMLADLRNYLQGVTSNTLCIEEHLYKNIKVIQCTCHQQNESLIIESQLSVPLIQNKIPRKQCNTIPEAHCCAFDFVETQVESEAEYELDAYENKRINQSWDLIYTANKTYFQAQTNQETHDVICERFKNHCIPDWVLKDNIQVPLLQHYGQFEQGLSSRYKDAGLPYYDSKEDPLSLKVSFIDTFDRNNTTSIFHKTSRRDETQVLDFNEIVAPSERTFVMNNGLRFIVFHCSSITDARRRALALALITLDRRKGDFLKVFCPKQLHSGNFMPNIKCWWDLDPISKQIPNQFFNRLVQPGQVSLRELPLPIGTGHSGLVLSVKDHSLAYENNSESSLQIRRQRNYDDLQMKIVLPSALPRSFQPSRSPSVYGTSNLHLHLDVGQKDYPEPETHQLSKKYSSDTLNQGQVRFNSGQLMQLIASPVRMQILNDSITDQSTVLVQTENCANLNKGDETTGSIMIEEQHHMEETSDEQNSTTEIPIQILNHNQLLQDMLNTGQPTNSNIEIAQRDSNLMQQSQQVATNEELRDQHQSVHISSQDSLVQSSKQDSGSMIQNPYSQQQVLALKSNKTFVIKDSSRVRATTGRAMKPSLSVREGAKLSTNREGNTTRNGLQMSTTTKADSFYGRQDYSSVESLKSHLMTSSLNKDRTQSGLDVRVKPQFALNKVSGIYMEEEKNFVKVSGSQKLLTHRPQTSFTNSQEYQQQKSEKNVVQDDIRQLIASVKRQETFRIREDSGVTRRKMGSSRSGTVIPSSSQGHHLQEINEQSQMQQLELMLKAGEKLNTRNDKDQKAMNVSKQRLITHLISNSIDFQKEKRLQIINKLNKQQKKQHQITVVEREQTDFRRKNLKKLQRAQSSMVNRSKREQGKEQANRLSSAANMLNKVTIEKLRENAKRKSVQNTQWYKTPYANQATTSSEQIITSRRSEKQQTTVTPQFMNLDTSQINKVQRKGSKLRKVHGIRVDSQNDQTDIATQRLESLSHITSNMMPFEASNPNSVTGLRNIVVMNGQQQQYSFRGNASMSPLNNILDIRNNGQMRKSRHEETLLIESKEAGNSVFHQSSDVNNSLEQMQMLPPIGSFVGNQPPQAWPDNASQDCDAVYKNLANNPAINYGDTNLGHRRQDQQFEYKPLPVKLMQQLPYNAQINRDIQSDLICSAQQLHTTKKKSQLSDGQSSRNGHKSQYSSWQHMSALQRQQNTASMPFNTMKEYQLQVKRPKSKSRPQSKHY